MNAFPQTIHFTGTNTPRRIELSIRNLEVEGEIPAEIDGAFFRAVPDNAHAPMFEVCHPVVETALTNWNRPSRIGSSTAGSFQRNTTMSGAPIANTPIIIRNCTSRHRTRVERSRTAK